MTDDRLHPADRRALGIAASLGIRSATRAPAPGTPAVPPPASPRPGAAAAPPGVGAPLWLRRARRPREPWTAEWARTRERGAWPFAARWARDFALWFGAVDLVWYGLHAAGVPWAGRNFDAGPWALAAGAGVTFLLALPLGLAVYALNDRAYERRTAQGRVPAV